MKKYKISQLYMFSTTDSKNIEKLKSKILNKNYYKFLHPKWTHYCRNVEIGVLAKQLTKDSKILEIGSGDGYVAHVLEKEYGLQVLASDMDPRFPQYTDVKKIDGQSTDFQANEFDTIISVHVLEHIEDIDKALTEFSRLLKDDGVMYHLVPSRSSMFFTAITQPLAYFRTIYLYANGYYYSRFYPLKNKNIVRFIYSFFKALNPIGFFWGAGHGVHARIDCFSQWKVSNWTEKFEQNGLEVIIVESSDVSYSMHKIFPFKFKKIRNYIASRGFSSANLFILKKKNNV